jgi:adenosylcobinamide-phosphate synthase
VNEIHGRSFHESCGSPSGGLLDQLAGDPEWFPHPVRLIGFAISRGENTLRQHEDSDASDFISGTLLTAAIVGSTYWLTGSVIKAAHQCSPSLGGATEVLLGWTCLAARNLEQEASAVTSALQAGDLREARLREISRAVIETVAESASDGIIAPLFYMFLGGVPLAMAYKAVNTLDSMIGHADDRYFYFGKAAARLDDVANYLPSRITALAIVAVSYIMSSTNPQTAWKTWLRDGAKHRSPNAGQPESAIAGALQVQLGGDNTYAGERVAGQRMGQEFRSPMTDHSVKAIRIVSAASLLGLVFGVVVTAFLSTRRND